MEILLLLFHCKQGIKKEERVKKKTKLAFGRSSPEHLGWLLLTYHIQPQNVVCRMWCNWRGLRRAAMADWDGRA